MDIVLTVTREVGGSGPRRDGRQAASCPAYLVLGAAFTREQAPGAVLSARAPGDDSEAGPADAQCASSGWSSPSTSRAHVDIYLKLVKWTLAVSSITCIQSPMVRYSGAQPCTKISASGQPIYRPKSRARCALLRDSEQLYARGGAACLPQALGGGYSAVTRESGRAGKGVRARLLAAA